MNSGIYKIANKVTGDFYIGSAVNLNKRFSAHKRNLINKNHPNIILQNVFNKYGLNGLSFEIVESVENKNNLIEREQHYIDTLIPNYNIRKIANSNLGLKFGPCSEDKKQKISKANKGNLNWLGKTHSKETKKLLAIKNTGSNNPRYGIIVSEETKNKMSKAHYGKKNHFYGKHHTKETILKKSKSYELMSPTGELFEGKNISNFCREHNLSVSHISQVLNGKRNHHKGWTKA